MKIFKTKKENLEGEFEKRWALKDEKVERIDLSKAKNNIFLNMEVSKGLYKNSKENGYWGEHKKNRALVKKHNEKMIEQEEAKEKSRKEIEIFNRGEGLDLVEYNHDKAFKYSDSIFPYSTSVNSIRNEFYSLDPDTIDNLLVIRKKENNSFTRLCLDG